MQLRTLTHHIIEKVSGSRYLVKKWLHIDKVNEDFFTAHSSFPVDRAGAHRVDQ
jgi:hypothetical protein